MIKTTFSDINWPTNAKVKPLFISPGHKVGQETAVELVLQCVTKYRLPEPTRIADKISKIKPVQTP